MSAAAQTTNPPTFPIMPGSYEGNINDAGISTRYQFSIPAGQTATISMNTTSGDLDPFLLLFDSTGRLLDTNDDFEPGNRNARIVHLSETDGDYIIETTRFDQESGTTTGTYLLTLALSGDPDSETVTDPLLVEPDFGVAYDILEFEAFGTGRLDESQPTAYFALGGQQGDVVRLVITAVDGDLSPTLTVLNQDRVSISRVIAERPGEQTIYAILPERGWYLVEAGRTDGSGAFSVYTTRLADSLLTSDDTVEDAFTPDSPVVSYVFNATIGDRLFASVAMPLESGVSPELSVLDINQTPVVSETAINTSARARTVIPRSGPYILQARSISGQAAAFILSLRLVPADISKLDVAPATYNRPPYRGVLTDANPVDYYRFTGKTGELVTISMQSSGSSQLDPYLILADSALNELTFNDNAGGTRNARITQFALPEDGEYFILATRPGLRDGEFGGAYDMQLTVGQLTRLPGVLTATLTWEGNSDLNLFLRTPSGRTVSWSNPSIPAGGTLQIDSNTGCQTPTAQPVEHIYWQGADLADGEYIVQVWYQDDCGVPDDVPFELTVAVNNQAVLTVTVPDEPESQEPLLSLRPDERYEASIQVNDGSAVIFNPGAIARPSAQQRVSQGGDPLILYGQQVVDSISDSVYARFYQFRGNRGDTVQVCVETVTGNLDPVVVLRDADERNLAQQDDIAPDNRNACLIHELPDSGRFVIAVTRYGLREGTTGGDFRLTLTELP